MRTLMIILGILILHNTSIKSQIGGLDFGELNKIKTNELKLPFGDSLLFELKASRISNTNNGPSKGLKLIIGKLDYKADISLMIISYSKDNSGYTILYSIKNKKNLIDSLRIQEGTEFYGTKADEVESIQRRFHIDKDYTIKIMSFLTYTAQKNQNGIYEFMGDYYEDKYELMENGEFKRKGQKEVLNRTYDIQHLAPEGSFPEYLPID